VAIASAEMKAKGVPRPVIRLSNQDCSKDLLQQSVPDIGDTHSEYMQMLLGGVHADFELFPLCWPNG
jgi:hypothetical protein